MLTGVSDNDSTATSLPNDGHADPDDATTPNAPANSHKGILYCQVPTLAPVLLTAPSSGSCIVLVAYLMASLHVSAGG